MSQAIDTNEKFLDRRNGQENGLASGRERRQFSGSHEELSLSGREFGQAIDQYKLQSQRTIVTYDEIITIASSLGYVKGEPQAVAETKSASEFDDRRADDANPEKRERRQFSSSYEDLSPEGQALGKAVDLYKLSHRRRYVTCDEILQEMNALGYTK